MQDMAIPVANGSSLISPGMAVPEFAAAKLLGPVVDQLNAATVLCKLLGFSAEDCSELVSVISKPGSCLDLLLAYINNLRVMSEDQANESSNAKPSKTKSKSNSNSNKKNSNSSPNTKPKVSTPPSTNPQKQGQTLGESTHVQTLMNYAAIGHQRQLRPQQTVTYEPQQLRPQQTVTYEPQVQQDLSALLSQLGTGAAASSMMCASLAALRTQGTNLFPGASLSQPMGSLPLLPPVSLPYATSMSTPMESYVSSCPMVLPTHHRSPQHSNYASRRTSYSEYADVVDMLGANSDVSSYSQMQLADHLQGTRSLLNLSPPASPLSGSFGSLSSFNSLAEAPLSLCSLGNDAKPHHMLAAQASRYSRDAGLFAKLSEPPGHSCAAQVANTHLGQHLHPGDNAAVLNHRTIESICGLLACGQ